MKLSTKGRYGVRAMAELACNQGKGPLALKIIAEKQGISEPYLEQLMAGLRKANLVKSVRGAQGGYILAKDPVEISIGDILRALEGSLAPVDCVEEDSPQCQRAEECVTREVWAKLRDGINSVIDNIMLSDICKQSMKQDNLSRE